MMKLCLNSRDELLIIDLDKIAFFQASGNYTHLTYIEGEKQLISLGLSKVEDSIGKVLPKDKPTSFVRLGRSLIINQRFLSSIRILHQKLVLSDCAGHIHHLSVSKQLLKQYKEMINSDYSRKIQPN